MNDRDSALETLSRLVLELQRRAPQRHTVDFRELALRLLQAALPFESGIWADGHVEKDVPRIRSVHLHNRPMEMLGDYESIKHQDPLFVEAARRPGKAVAMERATVDVPPAVRGYMEKWRLAHFMSVVFTDPLTALLTSVGIWRDAPEKPFREAERELFEHVFPHLLETYSVNRIVQLINAARPGNVESWACGVVDAESGLVVAPRDFVALLVEEWPQWRGPRLPPQLAHLVAPRGARFVGSRAFFKGAPVGDAILIQARPRRAADELTARELEIAAGFARGLSAKQIAHELDISAETVRDHTRRIFRKLGVKNQAQMAWEILRSQ